MVTQCNNVGTKQPRPVVAEQCILSYISICTLLGVYVFVYICVCVYECVCMCTFLYLYI